MKKKKELINRMNANNYIDIYQLDIQHSYFESLIIVNIFALMKVKKMNVLYMEEIIKL